MTKDDLSAKITAAEKVINNLPIGETTEHNIANLITLRNTMLSVMIDVCTYEMTNSSFDFTEEICSFSEAYGSTCKRIALANLAASFKNHSLQENTNAN